MSSAQCWRRTVKKNHAARSAPREHVEKRALIAYGGTPGTRGQFQAADSRKRGAIVDGLLAYTDDGYVVHMPTGRLIGPPEDAQGNPRMQVDNDQAFIYHMLDADPEAWEQTRSLAFGASVAPEIQVRLKLARDTYPGDPESH